MASIISDRLVKAFEKFNVDLQKFGNETDEVFVTLYEDAFTTRRVANFKLYKNGKLTWVEADNGISHQETEQTTDEEDAREWLKFWRANLRRAKRYWVMDTETLDKIQDGEIEDTENEED